MKQIMLYLALLSLVLMGCDNVSFESLVPSAYNNQMCIKESGFQTVSMNVDDSLPAYRFAVLRGGADISKAVHAKIDVMTQAELDESVNEKRGTHYKVLPSYMYALADRDVTVDANQLSTTVTVGLHPRMIFAESEMLNDGSEYVLPLRLVGVPDSVNANKADLILQFNITPVYISFSSGLKYLELVPTATSSSVLLDVAKTGTSSVKAKLEPIERSEIDSLYPDLAAVGYEVVDASAYHLPDTLDLSAPESEVGIKESPELIYRQKQAHPDRTLILPLKLVSASHTAVAENNRMLLYCFHTLVEEIAPVSGSYWGYNATFDQLKPFQFLYGTWSEPYNEHLYMFDGKASQHGWLTYVEDGYDGSGNYGDAFAVIDLGKPYVLTELGIITDWWDNFYGCKPKKVTYYVTNQDVAGGLELSESERRAMAGGVGELSTAYRAVDRKIRAYDKTVDWTKAGELDDVINRAFTDKDCVWTHVPEQWIDKKLKFRYLKIVLAHPSTKERGANRSRIWELGVKRATMVNGVPTD